MGERKGGRTKGVPNKATTRTRLAFAETWTRLSPEIENWIRETAEGVIGPVLLAGEPILDQAGQPILVRKNADPGRAADLTLKLAKFHVPELGRQELVGADGGAITVKVVKYGEDK
jgi:hypothetical protein